MSGTAEPNQGGTYITGARQWLRRATLLVGAGENEAIDLSALRFSFKILQAEIQTPNAAWIKVWNPSPETVRRIPVPVYTALSMANGGGARVVIQAGYEDGNYGIIFDGLVKQKRYGRDNATDTYMELAAADGDLAYNSAVMSITLAAGSTPRTIIEQAARTMQPYGVTLGPIPDDLPQTRLPRAVTFHCMARDALRAVATWANCNWSIVNGQLTFVPRGGYVEGDIVVLTANTGLIGMPEQTQDGIMVRCLLNPRIFVGRRIKLDNKSVQAARISLAYGAEVQNRMIPPVNADGIYRVVAIDWIGDTRGQDWYCDLTCISVDPTAIVPVSQQARRPYDISGIGA